MFDRPDTQIERAVIIHLNFANQHVDQEDLVEFQALVTSAGVETVATIVGSRKNPDPKYFAGVGKMEEIHEAVKLHHADVVLFNHALSPGQQRNLEEAMQTRVIDRTGLILDIFAQRARTAEGKLQVELAQLQHMATRLVHGWTHLERQKGGIGLRGPGETQLETDRRLIDERIKRIKKRLEKVRSQRQQNRQVRQKKPVAVVSLVGYTNAGKSTLFNALTGADVYAANQLFATLDPTLRRIELSEIGEIVLVDTVGFIRHLPHALVDSFRATLEETQQSDLLLHIIDASSELRSDNMEQVENVLVEIHADHIPTIKVFNKIDLAPILAPRVERNDQDQVTEVYLSAQSGAGLTLLKQAIQEHLTAGYVTDTIIVKPHQAKLRAKLFELQVVLEEKFDEQGNCHLTIRLAKAQYEKLRANYF